LRGPWFDECRCLDLTRFECCRRSGAAHSLCRLTVELLSSTKLWLSRKAVLVGVAHGLGAIARAGLVEDPVNVRFDRGVAEDERVRDLLIRETGRDQLENLDL